MIAQIIKPRILLPPNKVILSKKDKAELSLRKQKHKGKLYEQSLLKSYK